MTKKNRSRINLLQNLTIVLLTLSSIFLYARSQFYSLGLSPEGGELGRFTPSAPMAALPGDLHSAMSIPLRIAVTGPYGRSSDLRMSTSDPDFEPLGTLLNEVLGSAKAFSACSEEDFLGALMGAGIARETVGDICVGKGYCDFFVTAEIAPYVLQNFTGAGRTKLHLDRIPLSQVQVSEPEVKEIKDTLASLRLDSVLSSGFRVGRSAAAQYVTSGRVAIDGLPCEKPDKAVEEGAKISVRGLGKICLRSVNGQTKKGRISVVIDRYV